MKKFLDLQQHLSRPDAVELQQRNLASGLNQAVPVYSERPAIEDLSERSAWISFQDDAPTLEAHVDGVVYSVALTADGTGVTPPPSGSPAFRSSSTSTASPTSITVDTPAGVVLGDAMLAFLVIGGSAATITPPAGWTLITRMNNGSDVSLVSYWLIAGASPPATYSWTGLNTSSAATILAYSGANATPIDTYNSATGGSNSTPSSPAITTSVNNCLVIRAYGAVVSFSGGTVSITPPSGYTNRGQAIFSGPSSFGLTVEASDIAQPVAGASASANASATTNVLYASQTIAVKP